MLEEKRTKKKPRRTVPKGPKVGSDLSRLRKMTDADIVYGEDAPPMDVEAFMAHSKTFIWPASCPAKQRVTLRLDAWVAEAFRAKGKGYQTAMQHVLTMFAASMAKQRG
jgi:uncharacterized protein (DUF4415 family)